MKPKPDAFWQPQSFEELAAEQGVGPREDWDALTMDWPTDTDFEAFLDAIRQGREEEAHHE